MQPMIFSGNFYSLCQEHIFLHFRSEVWDNFNNTWTSVFQVAPGFFCNDNLHDFFGHRIC